MKRLFTGIISFCISFTIGYQFCRLPSSQIPFHGEAFVGAALRNLFIYFCMYLTACIFFAVKYSQAQKMKFIINLLCFFIVTAIIGFIINRYILFWGIADRLRELNL
jgi:hypothetical protein